MRLVLGWLLGLLVWPALATPPDFPTTWQVGETTLQRNGLGVREYGFFNIDGYAAALYLTQRSSDAEAILNSSTAKAVHMRFLRGGGDADDARRVWRDAIEANCPEPDFTLDEQALGEFLAAVPAARYRHNHERRWPRCRPSDPRGGPWSTVRSRPVRQSAEQTFSKPVLTTQRRPDDL